MTCIPQPPPLTLNPASQLRVARDHYHLTLKVEVTRPIAVVGGADEREGGGGNVARGQPEALGVEGPARTEVLVDVNVGKLCGASEERDQHLTIRCWNSAGEAVGIKETVGLLGGGGRHVSNLVFQGSKANTATEAVHDKAQKGH